MLVLAGARFHFQLLQEKVGYNYNSKVVQLFSLEGHGANQLSALLLLTDLF